MPNNEFKYYVLLNDFINVIHKDISMYSFEQLYRSVYMLSIFGKTEWLNMLFNKGKEIILSMSFEHQNKKYKLLYGVFMYALRIGIVKNDHCNKCGEHIHNNVFYCDTCNDKLTHLNNIHKFNNFKNIGMYGSKLYETLII